jgi:hypothetical protein
MEVVDSIPHCCLEQLVALFFNGQPINQPINQSIKTGLQLEDVYSVEVD